MEILMNEELDRRIAEYEKKKSITNDEELAAALEAILEKENKVRADKRDLALVEEATETLLELRGYNKRALEEEADAASFEAYEMASSEVEKKSVPRLRFKILIPVAVLITIALATAAIVSGHTTVLLHKDDIESMVPGETYEIDGAEVIISNEVNNYIESLDELAELAGQPDLLLPYGLGDEYTISLISYTDYVQYKEILIYIDKGLERSKLVIELGKHWEFELDTEEIFGFDVFLWNYDNVRRADFEYNDDMYSITSKDDSTIFDIIYGMEEVGE